MSGRFFTVPLLVAACLLGRIPFDATRWRWLGALGVILMLGLIPAGSPLKSNRHYGEDSSQIEYAHNIFNERAHYYPKTGMLAPKPWDLHIFRHSSRPAPKLAVEERIGMKGFLAGPRTYILDYAALANPLLAHLPAIQYPGSPSFRIGHFYRCIPEGYIATILEGKNLIQDDSLHTYYEVLETITRGPVWSENRFAQIVKMNLGYYDHLIDRDFYRSPPVVHRHFSDLETLPDNALWIDPRLDQYGDYLLSFMRNEERVFEVRLGSEWDESASLAVYRIQLPPDIVQQGYDTIAVKPLRFSNRHALGRVTIQGDQ